MTIRRFGVLSVGKLLGSLYACLGLLIGAVVSLVAVVGGGGGAPAGIAGAAAIVLFPLLYGKPPVYLI